MWMLRDNQLSASSAPSHRRIQFCPLKFPRNGIAIFHVDMFAIFEHYSSFSYFSKPRGNSVSVVATDALPPPALLTPFSAVRKTKGALHAGVAKLL